MDVLSGANYRSSMRFQPIHSKNEVDATGLQYDGRDKEFQSFDFNGNVVANHGGPTLARGGVY